ncbi:5'-nucleotidase [Acetobacter nitrogenifigens DSM 23921 = NBRC 105050]|uniref:2',3'-cyclic-nucleotide 2'-phosphodiesterase n=2 Tax=Acetobacter nitrogenifigens TaxID=285268 RepID=A0A511XE76_9PROT|nr:bifunctional 2',3'-cyclic-nucleotide 2'-phosphodiesterase/3'-nucleotidase [Acetobacter nitrogenifigens]GBQ88005.1 5'-nucleotidase [Acetobacter nitrogenifigens DSM 23921 = NBRC 105050]GEN61249.1 2',3'-cyclic-nucleotide 2'-phosphodiesterase [Acetobacter nitrogenifigens DSM 23921 = NBRC 105050]
MPRPVPRRTLIAGSAAAAMMPVSALAVGHSEQAAGSDPGGHGASPVLKLRLLETSDLHMYIDAYDYYRSRVDDNVGLARVATLTRAARAEVANAMLFDNGDIIQGNPLGDYVAQPGHLDPAQGHPIFRAMNHLGYDAATLGNHEFNYGLPFLEASIKGARFPFVCANVEHVDGSPFVPRFTVLDRTFTDEAGVAHTLKIGVIGFTPPQIMVWDALRLNGKLRAQDIVDAARRYIPELRARCDLLVVLCHSGISAEPRVGGDENAALYVAGVPGVDVIFTGHAHRVFPGPDYSGLKGVDAVAGTLAGKPAIMPGFWGSHLGVVDLVLKRSADGWRVDSFHTEVRPISQRRDGKVIPLTQDDTAICEVVEPEHKATIAWMAKPVGMTAVPIDTYFAFVGPDPSISLVNEAQLWYTRPLLAGTEAAKFPLLSAAAPFSAGGMGSGAFVDIPAGPLTMKDIASIYVFANTISVVRCTGAEVREWLERSAIAFNTVTAGEKTPQALLAADRQTYNFDVIAGLTYEIDVTRPPRYDQSGEVINATSHRINDLRYAGRPVRADDVFVVVTNNYRAGGGGSFPGTGQKKIVLNAPDGNRDAVLRFVADRKRVDPPSAPVWRFAKPVAPTIVTVDLPTSAEALASSRPDLRRLSGAPGGLIRYGLTLA